MNRISAAAALLASLSLCSTPAAALELPQAGPAHMRPAYDAAAETVEHRRSHHRRYRHRDNGIDVGDVIAGVLILGGIAAIAGAASQSRDRAEPSPYPGDPGDGRPVGGYESGGMDRAVDMCVAEVERGGDRVVSADSAARSGEGWFVSGEVDGGAPFTCRIDNDGRIGEIEVGDGWDDSQGDAGGDFYAPASGAITDNQYDDATYAQARADVASSATYAYSD
jgi:hypothetical protein